MMGLYPRCFPEGFEIDVLPKEAIEQKIIVYRICKYGFVNKDAFVSTYEEREKQKAGKGLKLLREVENRKDVDIAGVYSTSVYSNKDHIMDVLDHVFHNPPKAIIAMGETDNGCGPSQLTIERIPEYNCKSHYDWWIYNDTNPQNHFKKVDDENNDE